MCNGYVCLRGKERDRFLNESNSTVAENLKHCSVLVSLFVTDEDALEFEPTVSNHILRARRRCRAPT